ncbi:SusC/RagA family TonB-linked outer membrane protein [Hymenobacter sp. ASUV-10]|uniref:SusC/RagA family TonB-linked outer membrane protein n=1 Tax=Hymenobacter aranciens TaxID=3063996 RepID=A0ABT9BEB3_9BACT|nr:SusC/RagA family TonB-linked outer membrane protein [Hymenobacter sp. ASUV-10]MDO7876115.1 SusC/RagA family TonB-linked outer membrane protein [Hymenobacter sp. ASUV-10]
MKHPYLAKLLFLLLFLSFGAVTGAWAQTTGSVSGRITDEKNEGVPGATVIIDGTTFGGSSNMDGTYSIQNVPAGPQTLVISYVGYNTVRRPVTVVAGANTEVSAGLTENATALSEAVVIGYGTQRRQDITGAVAQVDSKQFVQGQVTNPEQLIQGKVAGVSITTGGGAPGAPSTIRIRGNSSLNANSDPLYVIDGVPVDKGGINGASNPLSLINPSDIETFTVLKDASATAIYGNRASGGVILITTKKGLQGEKLRVELNSQTGISTVARRYETLSAGEFRELVTANAPATQVATLGTANTDWQNEIFRTGATYDNTVSLIGSIAKKVPFRVSYGNLYQEGIVITNKLKRNSGSISLSPTLLDEHLRIDVNAKGSVIDNRFADYGQIAGAAFYDPTQPVRSTEGQYGRYGGYYQFLSSGPTFAPLGNAPGNPVAAINNLEDVSTVKRLIGNVQFDYKVHGVEGLRANLNLGLDIARGRGSKSYAPGDFGNYNKDFPNDPGKNGSYNQYSQDKDMNLLEAYMAYGKQLGAAKLDVQAGYAYQTFKDQGPNFLTYRSDRTTQINPDDTLTVPGFYSQYVLLSYFGRATVNVSDKYLLTATLRNDRTSRFRDGYNSGWFPALGLAWRIKGEDFLKDNTTISELKLRVGYGRTGQQDIGGAYDTQPRYAYGNAQSQYLFGNNGTGFITGPLGYNAALTWETTSTYNAGLDLGFADNRLTATIDVYQRTASDLLQEVNVPAGSNLVNRLNANVGSLRNRGIELGLNYGVLRSTDLNWDVNVNGAYNVNEITDLGLQDAGFPGQQLGDIGGGTGNQIQINSVGYAPSSFYVFQQAYGPDGRPLQGAYVDRNGNGSSTDDYYRYKQPAPLVTLGFSSNLSYKKLFFAFTLRSNLGNYVYNANDADRGNYANAKGSTLFVNNLSPDVRNTGFTAQQLFSDYYVQNASFLRCQNISLGYNVGKVMGVSTLRITGNVQNPFLITKYKGVEPEIFGGIDRNFYPVARTYTLGITLGI